MSGPTSRGPLEWPQDVFGCKRAFLRKCLFSSRKIEVLEGRVALRPPPRAIWTGLRSCYPWETPLPHSTKNKKNVFSVFYSLFSLFSALFPLPSKPPEVPPEGGMAEKRVGPPLAASFGDLGRPLLGSIFYCFFSLVSLFSPFLLLSSPCLRGLVRLRSHESSHCAISL